MARALDAMGKFHVGPPVWSPPTSPERPQAEAVGEGGHLAPSSALKNFGLQGSGIWTC